MTKQWLQDIESELRQMQGRLDEIRDEADPRRRRVSLAVKLNDASTAISRAADDVETQLIAAREDSIGT